MIEIDKDAILDKNQREVIRRIEAHCEYRKLRVTRGHVLPCSQLDLIARKAIELNIHFPEFDPGLPVDVKVDVPGVGLVYHWQRTWSRELALHYIVNPPKSAMCLDNYVRASGEKMMGKIIQESAHISGQQNGCWPIDFSGRINGVTDIERVAAYLEKAKAAGAGIQDIVVEHGNNCVHANTLKVV